MGSSASATAAVPASGIDAAFRTQLAGSGDAGFTLDVDFSLPASGVSAVFGASGSGKTTLLRCIAGLHRPEHGRLNFAGESWQGDGVFLPAHQRPIGYVFQEASLFEHLNTHRNLEYGIKRAARPPSSSRFDEIVALMGIDSLLQKYPARLSGGERQRVAIARALLVAPRLLLMDEPLASLDLARKQEILPYLETMHRELELPIVYVTHSVEEMTRLADYLLLMEAGRISAKGSLEEVLSRADLPIQQGQESSVVVSARAVERDNEFHLVRAEFDGGELWVRDSGDALGEDFRIRILARDVSLSLEANQDSSILNRLRVQVVDITEDADEAMALVRLMAGATMILARISRRSVSHLQLQPSMRLWAQIKSVAILR